MPRGRKYHKQTHNKRNDPLQWGDRYDIYKKILDDIGQEHTTLPHILESVQFPVPLDTLPLTTGTIKHAMQSNVDTRILLANIALSKHNNYTEACSPPPPPTPCMGPNTVKLELSQLIRVPITLTPENGTPIRIRGILDTGAQLPVLSSTFCSKHRIETVPIHDKNLHPVYFDNKTSLPSCQTQPLLVHYSKQQPVLCVFLVLDSDEEECLIGGKLREHLGLFDARQVATKFPPCTGGKANTFAVYNLTVIPTSPPSHDFTEDDDMITQEWEELPSEHVWDTPIAISGSGPTRQHVENHVLDDKDAALVAPYLPAILAALNENNEITKPVDGVGCFIKHPDAVVYLRHEQGTKPKYFPQPRMQGRKADAVRAQIKTWLAKGKIRLIQDNEKHLWNSQLLTAPKKGSFDLDGLLKLRVCFNGKPTVNLGLICDQRGTPPIAEILARCQGMNWFTELDCEDAYLQMILDAESQLITAFEFDHTAYCFVGAPYGITFIGNTFHNCIKNIFKDLPFVINYIDNIWIITPDNDLQAHVEQIKLVIARCNAFNIRLNLKKPVLCKRRFVGLGHYITTEGIALDPHKVRSIQEWQPHAIQTLKHMRSFLGSINFLRDNVYRFADIVAPLYNTFKNPNLKGKPLKDSTQINWTPELLASFKIVQTAIATAPMVRFIDPNKPIALATDASQAAVAVTLFQPSAPGELPNESNIVSFYSRALHKSEMGYAAFKLEFLGIITAIRRYHDFLYGTRFSLYTDHKALTWVWTKPEFNNTYAGWILELYDYEFDIYHIPGDTNIVPDTLSRMYEGHRWGMTTHIGPPLVKEPPLPCRTTIITDPKRPIIGSVTTEATDHDTSRPVGLPLDNRPPCLPTTSTLATNAQPFTWNTNAQPFIPPTCMINTLHANSRDKTTAHTAMAQATHASAASATSSGASLPSTLMDTHIVDSDQIDDIPTSIEIPPPTAQQISLVEDAHALGHFGVRACYNQLKRNKHNWPHMCHHVRQIVESCSACQRWSIVKRGYNPIRSPLAWWPFDILQYDLTTNVEPTSRGNTTLLIVVCVLTGFTFLRPLPDKRPETITRTLLKIFCDFGTPRILHSDNEPALVTDIHKSVCEYLKIHTRTSLPYKPNSLGKAERMVATAMTSIHKTTATLGIDWDLLAEFVQLSINLKIKDITGTDPFALMFHRPCNIFNMQGDTLATDSTDTTSPAANLSLDQWIEHSRKLQEILFPAIRERIKVGNSKATDHYESRHKIAPRELPIGTLVAIKDVNRTTKMEPPMLAPYTVFSKSDQGGYILRDDAGGILARPVPIEHIRPLYHAKRTKSDEPTAECYVDFILSHRQNNNRDEYLVKWMGTDDKEWIPSSDIADYSLIHEYLASLKQLPRSRKHKRESLRRQEREIQETEKRLPLSTGATPSVLDTINVHAHDGKPKPKHVSWAPQLISVMNDSSNDNNYTDLAQPPPPEPTSRSSSSGRRITPTLKASSNSKPNSSTSRRK